jgi:hypothetical protein
LSYTDIKKINDRLIPLGSYGSLDMRNIAPGASPNMFTGDPLNIKNKLSLSSNISGVILPPDLSDMRCVTGLTTLYTITLPNNAQSLAGLTGCTNLRIVNLPPSVTKIAANACSGCSSLITIDLAHVTEIADSAFQDCYALDNIDLSSLTSAKIAVSNIFLSCRALTHITLPAGLQSADISYLALDTLGFDYSSDYQGAGSYTFSSGNGWTKD